ncbi:MAG: hypothetical protein IKC63_07765 [Clostridia bacterium]|nr:hypothetical protein [Clostridia bacterium]
MMINPRFATDTPYLLTLSSAADQRSTTPYLDALGSIYRLFDIESPLDRFDGDALFPLLEKASVAAVFLSAEFLKDDVLTSMLHHLVISDVPILLVHLEEVELSPGMQLQLSLCPQFYPNRHPSLESAVNTLKNAAFFRKAIPQS